MVAGNTETNSQVGIPTGAGIAGMMTHEHAIDVFMFILGLRIYSLLIVSPP